METGENGQQTSPPLAALRLSAAERKALVAKALAAADAPRSPDDEPLDDLALLEDTVRMLQTTLAMPCFAEPSLRDRIYALASSAVHTPFESSWIRLAGFVVLGLLAGGLLVWLDHSSEAWVVEASRRTTFWLGMLGLLSAAILAVIFLVQRYAPKHRSNV
jgi:hypothetical protein